MKFASVALSIALGIQCTPSFSAPKPDQLNPTDIGSFDKRQFVNPLQALPLGKDVGLIVGNVAVEGSDHTLTITNCRKIIGASTTVTTADLSQPVFSAVIDGTWGFKVALSFLDISNDGNTKITVTATDIADATIPQANIPASLSAPIAGCVLPTGAPLWYVQKATLTLINKLTYVKTGGSGGILSFLKISGVQYDQTNQTNMYTVSVYAVPIYSEGQSVLRVAKTVSQVESLGGKFFALGVDKAIGGSTAKTLDLKYSRALKPATISQDVMSKLPQ
jgi:hypothetical protein